MFNTSRLSLDRLGLSASTLCAIHCLTLPLLLSVVPAVGLGFLVDSAFESGMIAATIVIALASLGSSWRLHRRWNALMIMTSGALLLLFNFYGHESHTPLIEELHPWIAGLGGLLIASAHWINIRLCRACLQCNKATPAGESAPMCRSM